MQTLLIALAAGVAFIVAYHTYGRWLGSRIFQLSAKAVCPSVSLRDDRDYVPTAKSIVFGHHFTSIAGTGPIVGPAIAVMWGWLPALLWVVLGSIFIGAVHDLGSLVVSLRNNGQSVGDIAGRLLNPRVRLLFLLILFMALTIVLAIFGLVIANVFRLYPASIFPVWVQLPIAIGIGVWLHRKGKGLLWPSIVALALMYLTVVFGDQNTRIGVAFFDDTVGGALHVFNTWAASLPIIVWVAILLVYSYVASVLPVWVLLQPRDYINSLQLISALGLIVAGLVTAAFIGGAPPVEGAERVPLKIVAPMVDWQPSGAPMIFPFLFITIACGAISGFHCLVSSGTSSKQLRSETDARFVGYGSMLTEGFLATLVILACVAGLGLGSSLMGGVGNTGLPGNTWGHAIDDNGRYFIVEERGVVRYWADENVSTDVPGLILGDRSKIRQSLYGNEGEAAVVGSAAFRSRYTSWSQSGGLARTVGAFVDGSANFLKAMGVPGGVAVALMGVLVASFAGTTLDTACRLQRYVVQELAGTFVRKRTEFECAACGYDMRANPNGACPECGCKAATIGRAAINGDATKSATNGRGFTPIALLRNPHGATIFAIVIAAGIAALPSPGSAWSMESAGKGGQILWPLFGATNQLLGGLAFLVIAFYLLRRNKPVWFVILPGVFMLVMPMWAMLLKVFSGEGAEKGWLASGNWLLLGIAVATMVLEVWMIVEAVLLLPRVRGVLEEPPAGGVARGVNPGVAAGDLPGENPGVEAVAIPGVEVGER